MSTDSVAQDQIKAFVDRILRMKEEARSINDDIREIYAEAKGNGFDKTVLGKVVNYVEKRAKDRDALAEGEAVFDLYLSAYDGARPNGTRLATHRHETTESTAALTEVRDNTTADGPRKPSSEPEAGITPPAGTQAPPVDTTFRGLHVISALRPDCLNPTCCAGQGKEHCWSCKKAAGEAA